MLKRFVLIAAATFAVLGAAEVGARLLAPGLGPSTTWYSATAHERAGFLASDEWTELEPHTIFVGSSQVGMGVDVELYSKLTGHRAANMGLPNAGPHTVSRWLQEEILPRSHPSRIVLGTSSFEFNENFDTSADLRYDDQVAIQTGFGARTVRFMGQRFELVARREVLSNPSIVLRQLRTESQEYRYTTPMFDWPRPQPSGEAFKQQLRIYRDSVLRDYTVDENRLRQLGLLLDELGALDLDVVVVFMPVTSGFIETHPDGRQDFDMTRRLVEELVESRNMVFLDLSEEIDEAKFYDNSHLGLEGARVLTKRLAEAIAS